MTPLSSRELAYSGLFGAAALLLPPLFHLVHLGHIFMPMYLPLCTLPFFVRPAPAAVTAALVPLISAVFTGMPPFFPPVALLMAIELATMGLLIALLIQRWPQATEWWVLVPVLLTGRALYVALVYLTAQLLVLPAGFLASASLLSGWPGIVLMTVAIPPIARLRHRTTLSTTRNERAST